MDINADRYDPQLETATLNEYLRDGHIRMNDYHMERVRLRNAAKIPEQMNVDT